MMTRAELSLHAPCAPRCFQDRSIWLSYLESVQFDKVAVSRPFLPDGSFNPAFSHCRDCDAGQQQTKRAAGLCDAPEGRKAFRLRPPLADMPAQPVRIVRRDAVLDVGAAGRNAARRTAVRRDAS